MCLVEQVLGQVFFIISAQFLQTRYTLGRGCERDPYHPAVIRTSLTRNVGHRFPDVRDEIVCSFANLIPLQGEGT
jgi:hypothetical protein